MGQWYGGKRLESEYRTEDVCGERYGVQWKWKAEELLEGNTKEVYSKSLAGHQKEKGKLIQ